MTVTVIGHLCLDVIHRPDGSTVQGYGGIFFTLAALANLLPDNDRILPVFGVGKEDYDQLVERLSLYPNVDTSALYRFPGPTNQVSLNYTTTGERIECSKFISEPIPIRKIRPRLSSDLILINMISGYDITLETLDEIRMEVRDEHTPVYIDIHSLTLGIKEDFTRFHRPVDDWRRWLFMVHGVQMNEEEASIIGGVSFTEPALARHTVALNSRVLNITRGPGGCTTYIAKHKHAERVDISGIPVQGNVDPTGCGDVFAAGYCAYYLKTRNIEESARFANRVAAVKAGLSGSAGIDALSAHRLQPHMQEGTV